MGACNFGTIGIGKDVTDAYRNACKEAVEYAGHQDGYNGTISTTSGFNLCNYAPKYGTKDFLKYEEVMLDKLEKRGRCAGVEIKGKTANEIKARSGYKGKHVSVFYFFGWAAE